MQNLNEKIAEITAKSAPTRVKYFELLNDCSLTPEDAGNILGLSYLQVLRLHRPQPTRSTRRRQVSAPETAPAPRPTLATIPLTFGVEIECILPNSVNICAKLTSANITNHNDVDHYNHRDSQTSYKIMTDGSITSPNYNFYHGREIVSPVLQNYDTLQTVCRILKENHAMINQSCGLHVHIGAAELSDEAYVNVFVNYKYMEAAIDKFMAKSRRENKNGYCQSLKNIDFSSAITATTNQKWVVFNQCFGGVSYETSSNLRYFKVNAHAYGRHKTIEFRQHQGTIEFEKIKHWIEFLKKLIKFSKTTRLDNSITEIDNIPFLNDREKTYFKERARVLGQ